MKRHRKQISLNGTWKFRTDPDGMGDVSPDIVRNTIGATAQPRSAPPSSMRSGCASTLRISTCPATST